MLKINICQPRKGERCPILMEQKWRRCGTGERYQVSRKAANGKPI